MSAAPGQPLAERLYDVAAGDDLDRCSLCGIERQHAGYICETCGDDLQRPGCFVLGSLKQEHA